MGGFHFNKFAMKDYYIFLLTKRLRDYHYLSVRSAIR